MSDEVKVPTAEAVVTATPVVEEQKEPNWLPARLERERKKVLADLGVDKVEDAKAAIEELKAKREADKSELQKLLERQASLEVTAKRATELEAAVKIHAEKALSGLTPAQAAAVRSLAGDDAAKIVGAIEALRSTWAAPIEAPTLPATTAPPAKAPPESSNTSSVSHRAVYESLKSVNPIAAAEYRFQHYNSIAHEGKT